MLNLVETRKWLGFACVLSALGLMSGCADVAPEQEIKTPDTIYQHVEGWEVLKLDEAVESPHPYENDMSKDRSWTVKAPVGAESMRIYFDKLDVERGYDQIRIYDFEGKLNQTLTGTFEGWSESINGAEATIVIVSDYSVTGYGFSIGTVQFKKPQEVGEWVTHELGGDKVSTPHPYPNDFRDKWTITGPEDATAIRVNFSNFAVERGYDFVYIYDGNGVQAAVYTGLRLDFTSASVAGNQITVELVSDYSVTGTGFDINSFDVLVDEPSGCRGDDDCSVGQVCEQVQCIRAPCPPMCVPARDTAGPAERCGEGVACARGLSCTGNLSELGTKVCAAPTWDEDMDLAVPHSTETPYKNDTDQTFHVQFPMWVERYALSFSGFDLEANYDYAHLFNGGGSDNLAQADTRYTGARGDFTTEVFEGNYAEVRFISDYSVTGGGFNLPGGRAFGLPNELVTVYYDPAQCVLEDNPGTAEALTAYLAARGITVYSLRSYSAHEVVCRACSCPRGDRFVMTLSPQGAEQYLTETTLHNKGLMLTEDAFIARNRPAVFTTSPKQCLGNAWNAWARENNMDNADEPTVLRAWFEAEFGVKVMFSYQQQTSQFVCMACSCPRGDTLHVMLDAAPEQFQAIEAAGWKQF